MTFNNNKIAKEINLLAIHKRHFTFKYYVSYTYSQSKWNERERKKKSARPKNSNTGFKDFKRAFGNPNELQSVFKRKKKV